MGEPVPAAVFSQQPWPGDSKISILSEAKDLPRKSHFAYSLGKP